MIYPLAADGVWWTLQGEGHLSGVGMVFVRLGGCSVGCANCDTDYRVARRASEDEIAHEVLRETRTVRDRWVWITGGEPTDHDLTPLVLKLKNDGHSVAVAISGERPVTDPVDWLSVSPHRVGKLRQKFGHELKITPGLYPGESWMELAYEAEATDFWFRYLQPLSGHEGSLKACMRWIMEHPNWSLSEQRHLAWGLR